MRVSIRFDAASQVAIAALIYEVADYIDSGRGPVFISDGGPAISRFDDLAKAVKYLAAALDQPVARRVRVYSRRPAPFSGQRRLSFRKLALMCGEKRTVDLNLVRQVLRREFHGRYLIVSRDPQDGVMRLSEIGDGYLRLNERWRRQNLGEPFGDFIDRNYSTFVKEAYEEAWQGGRTVLEEIEASFVAPTSGAGSESPDVMHYDRLLLPIRTGDGQALLSATLVHR